MYNWFTILLVVGIFAQAYSNKVGLCVSTQVELNKCNDMNAAAKSHGLPAQFDCILKDLENCIARINNNKSDAVIVDGHDYSAARAGFLVPILYEAFGEDNVMVAVASADMTPEQMKDAAVKYSEDEMRSAHAAMYLNNKRGNSVCGGLKAGTTNTIEIVKSTNLTAYENSNMKLICPTLERKDLSEYKKCHVEAHLVNAVFVPKNLLKIRKDDIVNAFKSVVENFGPNGPHNSNFKIFGKYKEETVFNGDHVLFSDDAIDLLDQPELPNGVTEKIFTEIHCHGSHSEHHHHPTTK